MYEISRVSSIDALLSESERAHGNCGVPPAPAVSPAVSTWYWNAASYEVDSLYEVA